MATYNQWLPLVRTHARSCPDIVAIDYIGRAAEKFCREVHVWQVVLTLDLVADQVDYPLTLPTGANFVYFRGALLNDYPVAVKEVALDGTVTLKDTPSEDDEDALAITVALSPDPLSTNIPDFLWKDYRSPIRYLALADLLVIPDQPWTNGEMAGVWLGEAKAAIGEAKRRVNHNYGARELAARMRPWA